MKRQKLKLVDDRPNCSFEDCDRIGNVKNPLAEPLCDEHFEVKLYDYFYPICPHCESVRFDYTDTSHVGNLREDELRFAPEKRQDDEFTQYEEYDESNERYVCDSCMHDDRLEPVAIVKNPRYGVHDEDDDEGIEGRYSIGYCHNETSGDFTFNWSGSGYRGSYELTSKIFTKVHDDAILSYSEDEKNLKKFHDMTIKLLDKFDIDVRIAFPRTSNIFCCGYEMWIRNEDLYNFNTNVVPVLEHLKVQYRDADKFSYTALSGKDPSEDNEYERKVDLYDAVIQGEDPEAVVQQYLREKSN